jgi:hypothetical protein
MTKTNADALPVILVHPHVTTYRTAAGAILGTRREVYLSWDGRHPWKPANMSFISIADAHELLKEAWTPRVGTPIHKVVKCSRIPM